MEIDIPAFQHMMLQYWNTPTMLGNILLGQIMFGCPILDFLPVKLGNYKL
jgi:hypothetical protein